MGTIKELFGKYGIRQLGYYVEDIEEAATVLHDAIGAGPFVDTGINTVEHCNVRGQDVTVSMHTAMGHINDIQLELIQVLSDGPDPYRENGRFGLHHFCIYVDDVDEAISDMEVAGLTLAMRLESGNGITAAYLDAREVLGQYIEVCTPAEQLWQAIKSVHDNADEDAPALVPMSVLMG